MPPRLNLVEYTLGDPHVGNYFLWYNIPLYSWRKVVEVIVVAILLLPRGLDLPSEDFH